MRHSQLARLAGVPVVAAALGALAATPAFADVTVSPTTAVQGSGDNLDFKVTNKGDKPVHKIRLQIPEDTPVAEIYPLSIDNWGPLIQQRKLSTALPTLHGDTPTTETASAIEWTAAPGKDLAPGASTVVRIAIGPLPTLSSMQFTISTSYADGKAGPAEPPATLTLTPAPAGAAAPAGHHGGAATGTTAGEQAAQEAELFKAAIEEADRGPSIWSIAGWVVAGLALLGGAVVMYRSRHRADDDTDDSPTEETPEEETAAEEKEPVTAGSGNSKWAYKG
ncbi:DUF1775 domain-containing protein [Actinoplanes sp. LDG1-06]|uniref:DUF1775 domain-containing protein n=1 Tax=Paractinoplanes ovalisporus TaxID=2810368 RepID=A0ABS2ALB6_9ACTN|nr:DUF1775 domain-containing protein [Actinoplanes ovalisporus]MBM2620153.1 DUF1775 domain-containing protein [Actinoplanes ovalisporus]